MLHRQRDTYIPLWAEKKCLCKNILGESLSRVREIGLIAAGIIANLLESKDEPFGREHTRHHHQLNQHLLYVENHRMARWPTLAVEGKSP